MDVENLMNDLSVEDESPKGISEGGIAGASVDEAQLGSVDVASAANADGEKADPQKRNRSGAEKRRARKARMRASTGPNPGPGAHSLVSPGEGYQGTAGNKRRMGSNDTPPSTERATKRPRAHESGTYAGVADPLTRVIVAEGYPDEVLSAERLALLRGAVSKEIDGVQEGPVPRFCSTHLRGGAAIVKCADEVSLDWLKRRIGGISPWEGARLKVVGLEVLQKQHRAVMWVPGPPETAGAVLKRLERQNSGLATAGWRVYAENVGATSDGRNYILGVPESSVLKLRATDFRLFLGMDQVTVKVSQAQEKENGKEDPLVSS